MSQTGITPSKTIGGNRLTSITGSGFQTTTTAYINNGLDTSGNPAGQFTWSEDTGITGNFQLDYGSADFESSDLAGTMTIEFVTFAGSIWATDLSILVNTSSTARYTADFTSFTEVTSNGGTFDLTNITARSQRPTGKSARSQLFQNPPQQLFSGLVGSL